MFFQKAPKSLLDQGSGGVFMATKSSFFLAVLLIANPFMLLAFQNCSSNHPENRAIASTGDVVKIQGVQPEFSIKIDKNLEVK